MPSIKFPDGSKKKFPNPIKGDELAKKIGSSLFKSAIAIKIDGYLKADPILWNAYFNLLKKIDRLTKNDLLYKDYLKIYPSPELQIQWISPKKKVI